jgi:hypothetical protein
VFHRMRKDGMRHRLDVLPVWSMKPLKRSSASTGWMPKVRGGSPARRLDRRLSPHVAAHINR